MIRLERLIVSRAILNDNMLEVSEIFNFKLADELLAVFIESILFDNDIVSLAILSETY
jgi:hypothetical protein